MKLTKEHRKKKEKERRIKKLEKKFGKERTDIMNKIKIRNCMSGRKMIPPLLKKKNR